MPACPRASTPKSTLPPLLLRFLTVAALVLVACGDATLAPPDASDRDGGDRPDGGGWPEDARVPSDGGVGIDATPGRDGGSPDGGPPPEWPADVVVDLRADADRDGVVELDDPADDRDEERWTRSHGAILLANLDDDEGRCPYDIYPAEIADEDLASCHDAADERVNGLDDLEDLASLRTAPWPTAPVGFSARVIVPTAHARLFVLRSGSVVPLAAGGALTLDELRAGADLRIEAKDIARGGAWSGEIDVVLELRHPDARVPPLRDEVRMRVAPVVVDHHRMPVEQVLVSRVPTDAANAPFRASLRDAVDAALGPGRVLEPELFDRWMQDFFEAGSMTMPGPTGPRGMRVLLRSPNLGTGDGPSPLRQASRVVYAMRGPGVAVVQQYALGRPRESWTFDNLGNLEVIPPHVHDGVAHPLGRLLIGSNGPLGLEPGFVRLLDAQDVQPIVTIDTSWLFVGHVDEVVTFLPAPTERGWILLIADPRLARAMLVEAADAGHGATPLHRGLTYRHGGSAERTISQVLDDEEIRVASEVAAEHLDAIRAVLVAETGLEPGEIVPVPFLFTGTMTLKAYQPGATNLLSLSPTRVIAPDPHGPIIEGRDPFRASLEAALDRFGIAVDWIDAWSYLHIFVGEVHCGVNTLRDGRDIRWWDPG